MQHQRDINFGGPYRVWPFANDKGALLSVATGRPSSRRQCCIYRYNGHKGWELLTDIYRSDNRCSTSGQPFLTSTGTLLVPVWDVDYYTEGATYFAIFRKSATSETFDKVFEDLEGTYSNHFLETAAGGGVYLGVGIRGGGAGGRIGFTPDAGYILRSMDDGKTFERVLSYPDPCCFYQGVELGSGNVLFTTRNQNSVVSALDGSEHCLGIPTRNIEYVKGLNLYIITSNSAILFSKDAVVWSVSRMPLPGYVLRYPTLVDGHIVFTAVGRRSLVVAYDMKNWFILFDNSFLTKSSFARMAHWKGRFFLGSEFDGKYLERTASELLHGKSVITPLSRIEDIALRGWSRLCGVRSRIDPRGSSKENR